MSTATLIQNIKMANNGYLILENMPGTARAIAQECAKAGTVTITNGTVHMPSTKPEFFKTPYPVRAFPLIPDGLDFEDAILARQEAQGLYD